MADSSSTKKDLYEEALLKQENAVNSAYNAGSVNYGGLKASGDKAYEELANQARIDKAMSDRATAYGDRAAGITRKAAPLTISSRAQSNLRNTLGKTERQHKDYDKNVELALGKLQTQTNSDKISYEARSASDKASAQLTQSNFDKQYGLQKKQIEFNQAYELFMNRKIGKGKFKDMTGIAVKALPKQVKPRPLIIKLPADYTGTKSNKKGYELRQEGNVKFLIKKGMNYVLDKTNVKCIGSDGKFKSAKTIFKQTGLSTTSPVISGGTKRAEEAAKDPNYKEVKTSSGKVYYVKKTIYDKFDKSYWENDPKQKKSQQILEDLYGKENGVFSFKTLNQSFNDKTAEILKDFGYERYNSMTLYSGYAEYYEETGRGNHVELDALKKLVFNSGSSKKKLGEEGYNKALSEAFDKATEEFKVKANEIVGSYNYDHYGVSSTDPLFGAGGIDRALKNASEINLTQTRSNYINTKDADYLVKVLNNINSLPEDVRRSISSEDMDKLQLIQDTVKNNGAVKKLVEVMAYVDMGRENQELLADPDIKAQSGTGYKKSMPDNLTVEEAEKVSNVVKFNLGKYQDVSNKQNEIGKNNKTKEKLQRNSESAFGLLEHGYISQETYDSIIDSDNKEINIIDQINKNYKSEIKSKYDIDIKDDYNYPVTDAAISQAEYELDRLEKEQEKASGDFNATANVPDPGEEDTSNNQNDAAKKYREAIAAVNNQKDKINDLKIRKKLQDDGAEAASITDNVNGYQDCNDVVDKVDKEYENIDVENINYMPYDPKDYYSKTTEGEIPYKTETGLEADIIIKYYTVKEKYENGEYTDSSSRDAARGFINFIEGKGNIYGKYAYLTSDELKVIKYYSGKGDEKELGKYLSLINQKLEIQQINEDIEKQTEYYKKLGFLGKVLAGGQVILSDFEKPLAFFESVGGAITGKEADPFSYTMQKFRRADAAHDYLTEDMSSFAKGTTDFVIGLVNFVDKLPFGEFALPYMALSAGGGTSYNMVQHGATYAQAAVGGGATALVSYAAMKIPVNRLLESSGKAAVEIAEGATLQAAKKSLTSRIVDVLKQTGVNALKQGGVMGGVSLAQQYADTLIDIAVMGSKSEFGQYVKSLVSDGKSLEDATKQANTEFFIMQPLNALGQGFFTGLITGGAKELKEGIKSSLAEKGVAEGTTAKANEIVSPEVSLTTKDIQKAIVDGIMTLEKANMRLKRESRIVNFEGLDTTTAYKAYSDYFFNKGDLGVASERMVKGIDEAISTGKLTKTEVADLETIKTQLNGSNGKVIVDSGEVIGDNREQRIINDSSKFKYKNNPMDNPKAAKDIVENPDAVYGYSPKPGSSLDEYAKIIDWTNKEQVAQAQAERIDYHRELEIEEKRLNEQVKQLKDKGYSIEDIAQTIVDERNQNRIQTYIMNGNYKGLEAMYARNTREYNNPNGPTAEYLFKNKYDSWEEVIFATVRSNLGMDACTGLYDQYLRSK